MLSKLFFHHDPSHNDDKMDAIAEEASKVHKGVRPAIEGEEITLNRAYYNSSSRELFYLSFWSRPFY